MEALFDLPPVEPAIPAMTHREVAERATRFIKRIHGCIVGAFEYSGGWSGAERVDGICWNYYGSFMVEAKVSRSDFLADKKKAFRQKPAEGVGKFRYFACPVGLIKPEELPPRWGLIYVDARGRCSMPVGKGCRERTGRKEKHPEHGWMQDVFVRHGSDGEWEFERNERMESLFLLYLAKRYKERKFMENIL